MSDKLEKVFQEALVNHELPYDAAAWNAVRKKLPSSKKPWNYWLGGVAAIAFVLLGFWVLLPSDTSEKMNVAKTDIIQEEEPNKNHEKATAGLQTEESVAPNMDEKQDDASLTKKAGLAAKNPNVFNANIHREPFCQWPILVKDPIAVVEDGPVINPDVQIWRASVEHLKIMGLQIAYCENAVAKLHVQNVPENARVLWRLSNGLEFEGEKVSFRVSKDLKVNLDIEPIQPFAGSARPIFGQIIDIPVIAAQKVEVEISQYIKNTKTYVELSNSNPEVTNLVWRFDNKVCQDQLCGSYLTTKGTHKYIVESYDHKGCYSKHEGSVELKEDYNLYVENSFTPNGDGLNDYFMPVALTQRSVNFKLHIMDRFGKVIYQTSDSSVPWDGSFSGQASESGVYIWSVSLINEQGEPEHYKGHITLIR